MPETRKIVFLGASYAGLGAAHYFIKHVYPQLPNEPQVSYQAIVVDPSSKWYQRTASPRGAVSSELMPADKLFLDIEPNFKQYGDKVKFFQAKATGWDDKARIVTIQNANGKEEAISYWALVLATGSKTYSPLFSLQGTAHTEIQGALRAFQRKLSTANSIVVAGGGAVGVETAGELGDLLNGTAGWFSSRPANPKSKITLITSSSKLLPELRQSISDQAEIFLNRVGVDVRYNTKISSSQTSAGGKTKVTLHDGEDLETDIYIPAMGVRPMSEYVPDHLKDEKGYVIMNDSTLRVDSAGPRVYALGDIGTYSSDGIFDIIEGLPVMETNLKRDLLASHNSDDGKPEGKDRLFVKREKEMQLVPVGRSKGVGAIFGWRVPSWFVWLIKGRDYMISKGQGRVDGTAFAKEVQWKPTDA